MSMPGGSSTVDSWDDLGDVLNHAMMLSTQDCELRVVADNRDMNRLDTMLFNSTFLMSYMYTLV